jgi:pimeloyl-ACP methyl ester carboxylesterase
MPNSALGGNAHAEHTSRINLPITYLPMLLLFALPPLLGSLAPVILVPGLLSSRLYVTTTGPARRWYCPSHLTAHLAWVRARYFLTPLSNCLLEWLTLSCDVATGEIGCAPNVSVATDAPGSLGGLMGGGLLGLLGPYFSALRGDLAARNYSAGADLLGAPYDWRHGLGHPRFAAELEALIARAWGAAREPVAILGHSFGAYLLAEYFAAAPARVRARVRRLVLVAPSWGGAPLNFVALWRGRVYAPLPFFDRAAMRRFVGSIPSYYVHIPNAVFSRGMHVLTGSLGNVTAEAATDLLFSRGRVPPENQRLLVASGQRKFIERTPAPIPIPVRVLYNSGLMSPFGLHLTNRTNGKIDDEVIFAPGDGTVLSEAISVLCTDWKRAGFDVECIDMKSKSRRHSHQKLLVSDDSRRIIREWLLGNETRAPESPDRPL